MKRSTTNRGFDLITFQDRYDYQCSIQKSSLASEDCIWLGIDDPDNTPRMHLTREQAKELVKVLKVFVDTGNL